jgi:predicted MPP superfamily phosphohydrolase
VSVSRRQFLRTAGVAAGSIVGTGLYTWRIEPHWIEIVRRPLPIRNLPSSLAGRTIAQISDIHTGPRVDDDYLIGAFGRVSSLAPDIVLLTGDLISFHHDIFNQMEGVYRHFPKGRLATLAVLGNHDYGPAWSHVDIADRIASIASGFGITVLRNQIHDVGGLQIVGLDDLWSDQFAPDRVLPYVDPRRASLVMSHNPDTVDLPVWGGYEGWILSGHTHGGQCKPPFFPPPLLPVRNRRYTAGEFAIAGNRCLYINRGLGHLTRVRFNVRPEITLFELA